MKNVKVFIALRKPSLRTDFDRGTEIKNEQRGLFRHFVDFVGKQKRKKHHLDNSQGKRKNFPTISVCIPNKRRSRDASSEVCVNQWVYMHVVLQILVCITVQVMLMIICMDTYLYLHHCH